ncbi:Gamma-butyrobetaine dioxygenase [Trapelia coarctata]|nr:Gamma-butyrobetaine dioxygenase [Trapelia coarctata]
MTPHYQQPPFVVKNIRTASSGEFLTVEFQDGTFTFHSQWLHDAQVEDGPYKQVGDTYTYKHHMAEITEASIAGQGTKTTLDVTWNDGKTAQFPSVWLRVHAPLVAKREGDETTHQAWKIPQGWLPDSFSIPEISYSEVFPKISDTTKLHIYETLVHESFPGLLKITDLPEPVPEAERKGENTIVHNLLKHMFGSIFVHPRRGGDLTYNIASHFERDVKKGLAVPNYNTKNFLMPHADQAFYNVPTRLAGLYILEGESDNTFVSAPAVLRTFKDESPELVEPLFTSPMTLGRAGHLYSPTQFQATVSTVATPPPGFPNEVYRFRWHPHYVGSLLTPFDQFNKTLIAHRKFQEIMIRDTHTLRVRLRPGDLYIMDNYKIFHGRENVVKEPRTAVGQSVPDQVVIDRWRELLAEKLLPVLEERWLVHVPLMQLYEMDKIING